MHDLKCRQKGPHCNAGEQVHSVDAVDLSSSASLSPCCITFNEGVAQGFALWLPTTVTMLALAATACTRQDAALVFISLRQPKNAMSESCLADTARGCMERLMELAGKITALHGPCKPAQDRNCHRKTST